MLQSALGVGDEPLWAVRGPMGVVVVVANVRAHTGCQTGLFSTFFHLSTVVLLCFDGPRSPWWRRSHTSAIIRVTAHSMHASLQVFSKLVESAFPSASMGTKRVVCLCFAL